MTKAVAHELPTIPEAIRMLLRKTPAPVEGAVLRPCAVAVGEGAGSVLSVHDCVHAAYLGAYLRGVR